MVRYLHQIDAGLESELFIKHPELAESEFQMFYRMYKSALFSGASIVKLQNNYRSTHNIVGICNEILQNAPNGRIEKYDVAANQDIGRFPSLNIK